MIVLDRDQIKITPNEKCTYCKTSLTAMRRDYNGLPFHRVCLEVFLEKTLGDVKID